MTEFLTPLVVVWMARIIVPLSIVIILVRYMTTVKFRETTRQLMRHPLGGWHNSH